MRLSVGRPSVAPKMQLLHHICVGNRCRAVWSHAAGLATIVGFQGALGAGGRLTGRAS